MLRLIGNDRLGEVVHIAILQIQMRSPCNKGNSVYRLSFQNSLDTFGMCHFIHLVLHSESSQILTEPVQSVE